jgi:multicomponent Na+:H+ antiporter subunit G
MLQLVGSILLLVGTLICLVGGIGLMRLPNFFARTHGGSITDTLGALLCILGMVVFTFGMDETLKTNLLVVFKLVSIGAFLLVTSPIAGHALTRSAYRRGLGGKGAPTLEDVKKLPYGIHGDADTRELLEGGVEWDPQKDVYASGGDQ